MDNSKIHISIHALREEGDTSVQHIHDVGQAISIHALREEGDIKCAATHLPAKIFLSTPSVRRATWCVAKPTTAVIFLSTPSVRRATNAPSRMRWSWFYFYPRPP